LAAAKMAKKNSKKKTECIWNAGLYNRQSEELERLTRLLTKRVTMWHTHLRMAHEGGPYASEPCVEGNYTVGGLLEEAISFLTNGDPPLIDCGRLSYVVIVNPFTVFYETVALLGPWGKEDRRLWLKEWLPTGTRRIGSGKLFQKVLELKPGDVMGLDWKRSDYISHIPKNINISYALTIPLFLGSKIVAIFVHDCGKRPTREYAAWIYRFCYLGLLPFLLPNVQTMAETPLVGAVTRILSQCAYESDAYLRGAIGKLLSVKDSFLGKTECKEKASELIYVGHMLMKEARRLPELIQSLHPLKSYAEGCIEPERLIEIIVQCVNAITSTVSAGFPDMPSDIVLCKINVKIGASEDALRRIMKELLLNSYRAIADRFDGILKEVSGITEKAWEIYSERHGAARIAVVAEIHSDGKRVKLIVTDNGIGMHEYVRSRVMEFGFTTRHNGTGIGLNIARANVEAAGGRIAFLGTNKAGLTEVTLDLKKG
jgi:hypothetical protein